MKTENGKRRIGTTAQAIFASVMVVVAQTAAAQVLPNQPAPDVITLDFDSALAKRLASVEDFVADKQWEVVATLLRQAAAENSDALVPLAPNWLAGVRRYCQCRAVNLPQPGLTAYRRQVDGTAKKWLDDAERTHDRNGWLRIVRHAFASSSGSEAVARLAQKSFEVGDFATARSLWELLVPASESVRAAAGIGLLRQPDSPNGLAEIRAALMLCSLFEGNLERARRELSAFQKLHPEATGRIAGRDGVLSELLTEQLRTQRQDSARTSQPELDQLRWSQALPQPFVNAPSPIEMGDVLPLITDDAVFVSNGESVFALDLATGRPKWSPNSRDDRSPNAAVIHGLADPVASKLPIADRTWHSLTVAGDRIYARLGSSVTGRARQETHAHSEIVGLDIGSREGQLTWRVAADELDARDPLNATAPWCFEGSPVADARRVFVALRRSLPQQQINVACFDAETARLLWNRRVGITVAATEETVNSASHLQLTLAEDSVFLATDCGAIAALDADDGAVRWLRTYPSDAGDDNFVRRVGHTPPLHHSGVLFLAPLDCRCLLAVHAESGLLLWQREWPDPLQYLLGISGDTLIVSGHSLWGVRLDTGEPSWPQRRIGFADPEGYSYGRGCVVGDQVFWPNRDELFVVAAATGRIARRIPLPQSAAQRGGHLTAAGPNLLISDEGHMRMLGPHQVRERE